MRIMKACLPALATLAALGAIPLTASAQRAGGAAQPPTPQFILRGLEQMRADSAAAAIATWTSSWKAPADASKAASLLASLDQLHDMIGVPVGYEVVGSEAIGLHLRRVYVLIRYESQPLFAQFVAYSVSDHPAEGDWRLATVTWNTNVLEAWPPSLWSR